MQAVPNMLELVPKGVNKGSGMRKLLANLELPVEVLCSLLSLAGALLVWICFLGLYSYLHGSCIYMAVYIN